MWLFLAALLLGQNSYGADLTPTEIYAKCHGRLSDHPVDIDSSDYKKVEAGTLDPIKACEKILDSAMFVASGNRRLIKNQSDQVAIGVLRNFNDFHKSWFSSIGEVGNIDRGFYNFVDHSEPALFITDALFGKKHYRTIFTRNDSIRGFRRGEPSPNYVVGGRNFNTVSIIAGPLDGSVSNVAKNNVEVVKLSRVTTGYLLGVEATPKLMLRQDMRLVKDTIVEAQWRTSFEDDGAKVDISENFGGGILGSAPYIMFNAESLARPDGGVNVHRRMANNTFYDLMCLTMPTLQANDVTAYLNKYKSSQLSFRRDKSCAQCHATLDPFANTSRNFVLHRTAPINFRQNIVEEHEELKGALESSYVRKYKTRTNDQIVADEDNIYIRRAPAGELFYRNYENKLIKQAVNGVADLGSKIAAQEDIYMCAAQRYYHFLTGVNISVSNTTSDEFYKSHRNQIISFGKKLKNHGSLRTLIVDILNSDAFKTRAPNLELVGGE